ncbi:MAG: DUF4390 domain-containing protein [Magnetococcales bacterium]|nr:DUF4390 domain-containing protein [Magnetococcales bacterium]
MNVRPPSRGWLLLLLPLFIALWLGGGLFSEEQTEACEGSRLFTCREFKDPSKPGVIQHAALFQQGERIYARAEMEPEILKELTELLDNGEPLWVVYRFRLYRIHPWWPDLRISQAILKRRLRLRLITRRYEMLDGETGQIQYSNNPEEAMNFLGAPRYVLMGALQKKGKFFTADRSYRLNIDLTLEHEDMSYFFHLLDRWFQFGQSSMFHFQTGYIP